MIDVVRCTECQRLRQREWFLGRGACKCGSRRYREPFHVSLWERVLIMLWII